jgi:hypothetical protein
MKTVASHDGTSIAFERGGEGLPIIFVFGAFNDHNAGALPRGWTWRADDRARRHGQERPAALVAASWRDDTPELGMRDGADVTGTMPIVATAHARRLTRSGHPEPMSSADGMRGRTEDLTVEYYERK